MSPAEIKAGLAADIRSNEFAQALRALASALLAADGASWLELDELVSEAWLSVADGMTPAPAVRAALMRLRKQRERHAAHSRPFTDTTLEITTEDVFPLTGRDLSSPRERFQDPPDGMLTARRIAERLGVTQTRVRRAIVALEIKPEYEQAGTKVYSAEHIAAIGQRLAEQDKQVRAGRASGSRRGNRAPPAAAVAKTA